MVSSGSSPLTRGKLIWAATAVPATGLIPAHAGKTHIPECSGNEWSAHPRSRGENFRLIVLCSHAVGSSPLTRGKPIERELREPVPGLIPAHAGKTVLASA